MNDHKERLDEYLARLKALPFVEEARVERLETQQRWDAVLRLRVDGEAHRLRVEHKRAPRLNHALLEAFLARVKRYGDTRWILFAPYVTAPIADRLREKEVNYIDLAGNCYLAIDRGHVALIVGRRPPDRTDGPPTGPVRYKVLFALLARPQTTRTTVRDIAHQAGVGKTVVAVTLKRLEEEGLIAQAETKTILLRPRELLDRWVTGYLDVLRPKLLAGHYRAADRDPAGLEDRIEQALKGLGRIPRTTKVGEDRTGGGAIAAWAWGGAAAAFRLIGHYRGEQTALHMDHRPADLARRLQLLPARAGEIAILGTPGPLAYEGAAPKTVHPLLVYAELLTVHDGRAQEAAAEVRDRFLKHLA